MNTSSFAAPSTPIDATSHDRTSRASQADVVFTALVIFVASVWLYHGLFNKLLQLAPRHLSIVQSVPGLAGDAGRAALIIVGVAEVILAGWIVSGRFPIACALMQTIALLSMNVLELTFARQHLLSPAGLIPVNTIFLFVAWVVALRRSPRKHTWSFRYLLQRHPLPIVADFNHSLVLTYAFPKRLLAPLLPPGLTLDTHGDFGFVAVAMVDVRNLRPAFLPRLLGQDFVLAGYRIFCRFRTPAGRTLRGLYILRSDANHWRMVVGGNLLTHYRYQKSIARIDEHQGTLEVHIDSADGGATLHATATLDGEAGLSSSSPFATEREARRFAGPLPYTFDYEPDTHSIIVIKGTRTRWQPRLVPATVQCNTFITRLAEMLGVTPRLASAFHVCDIPYRWERGVRMELPGQDATS